MRKTVISIVICLLAVLVLATCAQAKWWVFGKSGEETSFAYLYLNDASFDEKETNITLYQETLPQGMVNIRGKARTGGNKIGLVQVSLDGKNKWDKAKLADDGTFEYSFKADPTQTYELYIKVVDTTGKTNNVDATHKQIVISTDSMLAMIKQVLDEMVAAYDSQDARKFMSYVSEDFAGDDSLLDRAIRKDFTLFDSIDIRFNISNIASGTNGRVYVSLLYNRLVISTKDGRTYSDKGTTEFVFKLTDKGPKVYSMKNPLIFGLSDAENVATGNVVIGGNENVLRVGPGGVITIGPVTGGPGGGNGDFREVQITSITGVKHHHIVFHLACPNIDCSWDIQIEEAESPGGPWENVISGPYDSSITLGSDRIAQKAITLYYRARILDNVTYGPWSDVESWDNN